MGFADIKDAAEIREREERGFYHSDNSSTEYSLLLFKLEEMLKLVDKTNLKLDKIIKMNGLKCQ